MTTKQEKQLEKVREIQQNKIAAYNNATETALQLLGNDSPYAFELIWRAFEAYVLLAEAEEQAMQKVGPDYYHMMYVLYTYKNIKDIYWDLPEQLKLKWDAIAVLREWKDQYR